MQLRPYQSDAIAAINHSLATRDDNPLAVLPTAAGKTIVFGTMIRDWILAWPETRVGILAHRSELLTQAEDKMKAVWPEAPTGIWSASLNRKQGDRRILIAGIQSIYRRAFDLDPFDVLVIDEAHRIPVDGEGMYRKFLKDCKLANPQVRLIGFTATPWRMSGGHIAAPDHLLNHVCYEGDVADLVRRGYLATLRSKATDTELNPDGVSVRRGDYIQEELEAAVNTDSLVQAAVCELVHKAVDRKSWLVFCCGVSHANNVSDELARNGVIAPVVTGDTPAATRAQIIYDFDSGKLRAVVNVNIFTEGLDVTRIDCIALMRPTKSVALYVQMTGRGFRPHTDKESCLVLDFGGNVRRFGPVDDIKLKQKNKGADGVAPSKTCPECEEIVAAGCRTCPCCGHQFPPPKLKHDEHADDCPVLRIAEPWEMPVVHVIAGLHKKEGKPDSLKVTYRNGVESHREWICFSHGGLPGHKAKAWWVRRFKQPVPATASEALEDMFLSHKLEAMTESIKVRQSGKFTEILQVKIKDENTCAIAAINA